MKAKNCTCHVWHPMGVYPYKTHAAAKGQATLLNKRERGVYAIYRAAADRLPNGLWGLEVQYTECAPCSRVKRAHRELPVLDESIAEIADQLRARKQGDYSLSIYEYKYLRDTVLEQYVQKFLRTFAESLNAA